MQQKYTDLQYPMVFALGRTELFHVGITADVHAQFSFPSHESVALN